MGDQPFVASRSIKVPGTRPSTKVLPPLELKPSEKEGAGLGVFAVSDFEKNTWITEYGGELIGWETALHRRTGKKDSHIIGLSHGIDALDSYIDDRLRFRVGESPACLTLSYYTENHLVGGFLNDPHGTGKSANCTYHFMDRGREYSKGFHQWGGGSHFSSGRVFLRALRNINSGEELLVDYNTTYHKLHL